MSNSARAHVYVYTVTQFGANCVNAGSRFELRWRKRRCAQVEIMQSDESISFTKVTARTAADVMTSSPSQSRIYNPFDHDTPNRLQHSVFSPNMFTCVSSPSDEVRC